MFARVGRGACRVGGRRPEVLSSNASNAEWPRLPGREGGGPAPLFPEVSRRFLAGSQGPRALSRAGLRAPRAAKSGLGRFLLTVWSRGTGSGTMPPPCSLISCSFTVSCQAGGPVNLGAACPGAVHPRERSPQEYLRMQKVRVGLDLGLWWEGCIRVLTSPPALLSCWSKLEAL